jgi:hypothetical protein
VDEVVFSCGRNVLEMVIEDICRHIVKLILQLAEMKSPGNREKSGHISLVDFKNSL